MIVLAGVGFGGAAAAVKVDAPAAVAAADVVGDLWSRAGAGGADAVCLVLVTGVAVGATGAQLSEVDAVAGVARADVFLKGG